MLQRVLTSMRCASCRTPDDLPSNPSPVQNLPNLPRQHSRRERLPQERPARPTEAPPFQRVFRITRHQQHSQIGTHTAYLLRQHPAAHLRHDGIGQKQVDHPLEHGLWRPADFTATSYISTWMSTDCRRTPENPATANTCTANTAKW